MWETCAHTGDRVRTDMDGSGTATAMQFESNPWDQIKNRLSGKISSEAYQNWVMRTAFERLDGAILNVTVPDQLTKDWMEQEYAEDIRSSLRELNIAVSQVIYTVRAA